MDPHTFDGSMGNLRRCGSGMDVSALSPCHNERNLKKGKTIWFPVWMSIQESTGYTEPEERVQTRKWYISQAVIFHILKKENGWIRRSLQFRMWVVYLISPGDADVVFSPRRCPDRMAGGRTGRSSPLF